MEKVRVMFAMGGSMKRAGAETMIMQYLRQLVKDERFEFSILVHGYDKGDYDDEIAGYHVPIYHVPVRGQHPLTYSHEVEKVLKAHPVDIIHCNMDSACGDFLEIAQKCGIKNRIAHSHLTHFQATNPLKVAVAKKSKEKIHKVANVRLACSDKAGKWLYGNDEFMVINNAINLDDYTPQEKKRQVMRSGLGLKLENLAIVMAASLTLPMALKDVGTVLKTAQQKDKEGERLIRLFSMPCKPTKTNGGRTRNLPEHFPADWAKFKYYCVQDVNTEVDIYKRLKRFPMPDREWHHYQVNERINDRGVMIDTELVRQAIACDLMLSDAMSKKAYELTGLENPNSVSQLKTWLEERGIQMDTLGKKDVAQMIGELDKNGVDAEAMDMLKLRLQMAKSSVKKYQAAERCVCADGRARGLFQFYGASRTGRYSGRNIQLQNLPQNHISTLDEARTLVKMGCFDMVESIYGNTPDVLSQLIRTMLIPKEGCEFIVADFSAIEARVLAWEAEEQWVLDAFQNGEDLYCATASQMFHVPVVKHGVNGELRQKGKIATLACGYGGSSGALISMGALQMGLKEEELPEIIDSWREANPKIVQYWWDTEKAAMTAFKTGEEQKVGKIRFVFSSGTLWMVLPSERKLAYLDPKQQPNRFGRMSLTYKGMGQNHKWSRQETYSGRLVENATQAIARDILAEAMARIEAHGLNIVAHVHDEVIIEAPKGKYTVDEVCKLMSENPAWCKGLPLSAAGYKGDYYFKD